MKAQPLSLLSAGLLPQGQLTPRSLPPPLHSMPRASAPHSSQHGAPARSQEPGAQVRHAQAHHLTLTRELGGSHHITSQMRKLRFSLAESTAQGHMAGRWQGCRGTQSSSAPEPRLCCPRFVEAQLPWPALLQNHSAPWPRGGASVTNLSRHAHAEGKGPGTTWWRRKQAAQVPFGRKWALV